MTTTPIRPASGRDIPQEPRRRLAARLTPSLRRVWRNPIAVGPLIVIAVAVLSSVFAPLIATHDPTARSGGEAFAEPGVAHFFGTDQFGRDLFSRVVFGGQTTLSVALLAVGGAMVIGVTLGLIAGYYAGWRRTVINRVVDVLFAFPDLILAMGIAAALSPGFSSTVIAVGIGSIPSFARITYSSVLNIKENEYVAAARLSGTSAARILFSHILPNCISPVVVQMTLSLGFAVLAVAALSFVGLGAQPPGAEWGLMVSEGRSYILSGQWWMTFFPGLAVALLVLSFNVLGDTLRDFFDPHHR